MRTHTSPEATLLTSATKRLAYIVEIKDAAGEWQDMTSLEGRDWVMSIGGGDSVDDPIPSMEVSLRRDHDGLSLSPFRGDSALNAGGAAIDVGREIRCSMAFATYGATPADFRVIHSGVIDSLDVAQSEIRISSRLAVGAVLVDSWIREERVYGDEDGRRLDLVMIDILADWAPDVTLTVADVPDFVVTDYTQQSESVWDAIRSLAGLIGWDVRFVWDEAAAEFRPTLAEPARGKTIPDHTFAPDLIHSVDTLAIDRTWIRNVIRVTYVDEDGVSQSVEVRDDASIARFRGEFFAEIIQGSGSPINTAEEAIALANAALSDLSSPIADQTVQVPYFWPAETGDLYRFSANGIHYSSAQDLALTGHRWEIRPNSARSWLSVRGKPVGFYQNWIEIATDNRTDQEKAAELELRFDLEHMQDGVRFTIERGAGIDTVWVFRRLVARDERVFDFQATDLIDILLPTTSTLLVPYPPPNHDYAVLFEGHATNPQISGPGYPFTVGPLSDPPDRVIGVSIVIDQDDGSALIRTDAVDRALSYRMVIRIGTAPADIEDAEVEASALIRPITGSDVYVLPAGSIANGQTIKVAVAGYLYAGGLGFLGATDHSEIKRAVALRLKPQVSWLFVSSSDGNGSAGAVSAQLLDPGGLCTAVYSAVKQGEEPYEDPPVLETLTPAHEQIFARNVAILRKHRSWVSFDAVGLLNGQVFHVPFVSPPLDWGLEPNVLAVGVQIDEGAATAAPNVRVDSDTYWIKALGHRTTEPSDAAVRAATAIAITGQLTAEAIGALVTELRPGDQPIIKVLPLGPLGTEEGAFFVKRGLVKSIAAVFEVLVDEEVMYGGFLHGHLKVRLHDLGGQADTIYLRKRVGGNAWGALTLVTAAPADADEYEAYVLLVEGHDSENEFSVLQTLNGVYQPRYARASYDIGFIAQVLQAFMDIDINNQVLLQVNTDEDTRETAALESVIANIEIDAAAAVPTLASHDVSLIAVRAGIIETGITCPLGSTAWASVVAIGKDGAEGPARIASKFNNGGSTLSGVTGLELSSGSDLGTSCSARGNIHYEYGVTLPNDWTVTLELWQNGVPITEPLTDSASASGGADIDRWGWKDAGTPGGTVEYKMRLIFKDGTGTPIDSRWSNIFELTLETICVVP